ncbi:MAG: carboxypeptidase regulatory-like domain-containing protein [archaeon]|nr:carboxypeptidase regulatory-like domain-containing protein [archaeon]MCP8305725.1 carboxypeptidase regulatory-like domain-containing protein [archaeon]
MSEIKAKSRSGIIGFIRNQKGSALGRVKVVCDGKDAITLFDGTYRIEGLDPGTYTITVSLKGFQSQSRVITIREDETLTLDFYLSEARGNVKIRGNVYDAETKKAVTSGGTIILILPISNRYVHLDERGYYEFTDLVEDSYDIWTSVSGYVDTKATVKVAEGETKTHDFYCKPIQLVEPPGG